MRWSLARVVVLVVLVGVATPTATGGVTAQEQTTATVTVVDQAGERVGDVDLRVVWNNGEGSENVTTRANGQALVDVPAGATVQIRVTDEEYLRNSPAVFFGVDGGELEVEVSLPGTARVTATDSAGQVEGATARLSGQGTIRTADTGVGGLAVLGPVERGEYDLRVSEPGYLTNSTAVTLDGAVNRTITLREADRQLTVRVVDDKFDPPRTLSEATVEVEGVATRPAGRRCDGQCRRHRTRSDRQSGYLRPDRRLRRQPDGDGLGRRPVDLGNYRGCRGCGTGDADGDRHPDRHRDADRDGRRRWR